MRKITEQQLMDSLNLLDLQGDFQRILRSPYSIALKLLDAMHKKAKEKRKELAFKYHPDRPGGDEDKLKEVNGALDIVMKLKVHKPQPMPQIRVQVINMGGFGGGYSTYDSGTSWSSTSTTAGTWKF